jgi:hypothetical protein
VATRRSPDVCPGPQPRALVGTKLQRPTRGVGGRCSPFYPIRAPARGRGETSGHRHAAPIPTSPNHRGVCRRGSTGIRHATRAPRSERKYPTRTHPTHRYRRSSGIPEGVYAREIRENTRPEPGFSVERPPGVDTSRAAAPTRRPPGSTPRGVPDGPRRPRHERPKISHPPVGNPVHRRVEGWGVRLISRQ